MTVRTAWISGCRYSDRSASEQTTVTTSVPAWTEGGRAVPLELRARGAARVVVATLGQTSSRYEKNDQGDVLIVSYAKLQVHSKSEAVAKALRRRIVR